jgi:hypothetical protein
LATAFFLRSKSWSAFEYLIVTTAKLCDVYYFFLPYDWVNLKIKMQDANRRQQKLHLKF